MFNWFKKEKEKLTPIEDHIWVETLEERKIQRFGKCNVNFVTIYGYLTDKPEGPPISRNCFEMLSKPYYFVFTIDLSGNFQGYTRNQGYPGGEYHIRELSQKGYTLEEVSKYAKIISGDKAETLECAFQETLKEVTKEHYEELEKEKLRKEKDLKDTYDAVFKRYKKCI